MLPVRRGLSDSNDVLRDGGSYRTSVDQPPTFVHAMALTLDPGWRRLPERSRRRTVRTFLEALDGSCPVRTRVYSMLGVRPGADLLLWSAGPGPDRIEERAAAVLRSGLGAWVAVRQSLLGIVAGSPYR